MEKRKIVWFCAAVHCEPKGFPTPQFQPLFPRFSGLPPFLAIFLAGGMAVFAGFLAVLAVSLIEGGGVKIIYYVEFFVRPGLLDS